MHSCNMFKIESIFKLPIACIFAGKWNVSFFFVFFYIWIVLCQCTIRKSKCQWNFQLHLKLKALCFPQTSVSLMSISLCASHHTSVDITIRQCLHTTWLNIKMCCAHTVVFSCPFLIAASVKVLRPLFIFLTSFPFTRDLF